MTSHERRIADHGLLFELYRFAGHYQDLLRVAGNEEKEQYIKGICERVAREHVLDRVLKPEESK